MESARYCPTCGSLYDLTVTFCPACPQVIEGSKGVLLLRVWDYGKGFEIHPHAPSLPLASLEEEP